MRGEWVRLVAEAASTNAFAVFHMTSGRLCREVSTERDLLHVGEIFYELPADNAGGFQYVHPVAATPRHIIDYDTWKGCLVLKEADGALKIGVADDLWGLGKPAGVGGPWKETAVDGCGTWVAAGAHPVKAGETRTVEFPAAFSAYWVRVRADCACTATAQFLYR